MFDLDVNYLKGKKILDCPAGASSFTAELSKYGYNVVATNIFYDNDPDILKKKCKVELSKVMQALSKVEDMYIWKYFRAPAQLKECRMTTYLKFIKHYRREKGNRYIKSELTKFPFTDNEFSLILSSHFLFLYDDRLSYDFHKDSIQEML
ncbi:MAG: hypothetical protein QHH74_03045 [Spirochaetota bacterium]|nr:hypothetical protein [Spirochaetota bacterium]